MSVIDKDTTKAFHKQLWQAYDSYGRDLPWRQPDVNGTFDVYKIMVSEFMLQQTQVNRVIPKYLSFLQAFPGIVALADTELIDVLSQWSGLGYNRRAKYLYEAAQTLRSAQKPWTLDSLISCKGIGVNTASAIIVYAYNEPQMFIETNIRTVYIHHFFPKEDKVSDAQIVELLKETLDRENPREFYWALMDYGTQLKKQGVRNTNRSKHYHKQSRFSGSRRQIRGEILRLLTKRKIIPLAELTEIIADDRLGDVLEDLKKEGFVSTEAGQVRVM